jgi:hypothetical protein
VLGTGREQRALPLYVGVIPADDVETPLWIEALGCGDPSGCIERRRRWWRSERW